MSFGFNVYKKKRSWTFSETDDTLFVQLRILEGYTFSGREVNKQNYTHKSQKRKLKTTTKGNREKINKLVQFGLSSGQWGKSALRIYSHSTVVKQVWVEV